jgi:hypothetical protein
MFKKDKTRLTNTFKNLNTYIDGYDVYNSLLMVKIKDAYNERETYEVRTFEYRPDLIAKDIYGSEEYMGLLMLTCGVGIEGLYKGARISIIPKEVLDEILQDLNR